MRVVENLVRPPSYGSNRQEDNHRKGNPGDGAHLFPTKVRNEIGASELFSPPENLSELTYVKRIEKLIITGQTHESTQVDRELVQKHDGLY